MLQNENIWEAWPVISFHKTRLSENSKNLYVDILRSNITRAQTSPYFTQCKTLEGRCEVSMCLSMGVPVYYSTPGSFHWRGCFLHMLIMKLSHVGHSLFYAPQTTQILCTTNYSIVNACTLHTGISASLQSFNHFDHQKHLHGITVWSEAFVWILTNKYDKVMRKGRAPQPVLSQTMQIVISLK